MLRYYNPKTKIFGLFGGDIDNYKQAEKKTIYLLDDLFFYNETKDQQWKWKHGDLMINHWYRERGKNLEWNSLVLVQWDMLLFESIDNINMASLKEYYLVAIKHSTNWNKIYHHFQNRKVVPYQSNIHMVTSDAYTLTDGPTIYLAEDIDKVARFCLLLVGKLSMTSALCQ